MATHNRLGKAGEDAAVAYLERHDYVIRHRNWRKGHLELDIVAAKNNVLVIVEVKTRSNTEVMEPFEAVGGHSGGGGGQLPSGAHQGCFLPLLISEENGTYLYREN